MRFLDKIITEKTAAFVVFVIAVGTLVVVLVEGFS